MMNAATKTFYGAALALLCAAGAARGDVMISENTTIDYFIPWQVGWVNVVDGSNPPTVVDVVEGAHIQSRLSRGARAC
jgi:hypothetical protein